MTLASLVLLLRALKLPTMARHADEIARMPADSTTPPTTPVVIKTIANHPRVSELGGSPSLTPTYIQTHTFLYG